MAIASASASACAMASASGKASTTPVAATSDMLHASWGNTADMAHQASSSSQVLHSVKQDTASGSTDMSSEEKPLGQESQLTTKRKQLSPGEETSAQKQPVKKKRVTSPQAHVPNTETVQRGPPPPYVANPSYQNHDDEDMTTAQVVTIDMLEQRLLTIQDNLEVAQGADDVLFTHK